MSKKNANEGLGRALVRQHRKHVADAKSRASAASKRAVESVIDVKDIDAIIEEAERAGHLYSDSNPIPQLIKLDLNSSNNELTTEEFRRQQKAEEALYKDVIRVPRRPPWHSQMSAEQLDAHERHAFLEWRRSLARLEENEKLILTPFEKNIEIWRQLWRVLERSDLIVTVVDARNPLFYRCPDLEAYAKEIDSHKKTMLLVNKADLLPVHIRKQWATYFRSQGILYVYWSAKTASAILEGKNFEVIAESVETTGSQSSDVIDEDLKMRSREELLNCLQKEAEAISMARKISSRSHVECQDMEENSIVTGNGSVTLPNGMSERVVVGFVGYPNVGKSSTINALVGQKRTGVTSTPGKTKHFQTLIISDKLMLCDCPGLVFPSFSSSRHEMVTLGVLPIDRMTDHRGAIQIVADKVPRVTLESTYNIKLPKPKSFELQSRPPAAFELLRAYSQSRGYVGSGGLPDETRAARQILKDYIDGRLPHYELPPVQYSSTEAGPLLDELQNGGPSSEPEEASVQSKKHLEPKFVSEESESECSEESASEVESKGKLLHVMDSSTLEGVFDELDSFDQTDKRLSSTLKKERVRPLHKLHKKQPRRKDRTWRVGNDDGDGMPTSKAIQKPVSYGAAKVKI